MCLTELSASYAAAAEPVRTRLRQLRCRLATETDPVERALLRRRILTLEPILTELNALAELTAHYYDRGYYRREAYRI